MDKQSENRTMKAVRIHSFGDAGVLSFEDAPVPAIGPDEVLIKVRAAAVNPVDWKIRSGRVTAVPQRFPLILGWDVSGRVERAGALVTRFNVGDPVIARPDIARDGAYAEYIAVRSDEAAPAPAAIPLEEAAGLPLAGLTAWMCLFEKANLQAGQSVLIHAASGGVGSFAVQLARVAGARVFATTSAPYQDLVKSLGADVVLDYQTEDFTAGIKNVDVVVDLIGGDTQRKSWPILRKGGVLVSTVEPPAESVARQFGVTGKMTWVIPNGARLGELAGLVDAGKLKIPIDSQFPLKDVQKAHARSESGQARGKIILRVAET